MREMIFEILWNITLYGIALLISAFLVVIVINQICGLILRIIRRFKG